MVKISVHNLKAGVEICARSRRSRRIFLRKATTNIISKNINLV